MKWDNRETEKLIEVILALKNRKEAKKFLRDLLTPAEIVEFGNRWQAAKMLSRDIPYTKIEKETGLSSATVARVSKWLKNGKGGYREMINRMHHNPSSFKKGFS